MQANEWRSKITFRTDLSLDIWKMPPHSRLPLIYLKKGKEIGSSKNSNNRKYPLDSGNEKSA